MVSKKLLIIEDDPDTAALLAGMVCRIGWEAADIIQCSTLAEVFRLEQAISLVITDLTLPDSPADETFGKVQFCFPFSPIIVLTGNSEKALTMRTMQQGAQDYLIKGDIDQQVLQKSLLYAVERKQRLNDYRRLFDDNPVPMYIFDQENYRMLAANHAALRQYGYTTQEFLKLTAFDIRPSAEFQILQRSVKDQHGKQGYLDGGRTRHLKKDGTVFYVHIHVDNTRYEGRDVLMVVAYDIDSQVRTEEALAGKVREVEDILESITDAFFTLNRDGVFTYVNSEAVRILRLSKEELLHNSIWELFPAEDANYFFKKYNEAMRSGISTSFEAYYQPLEAWFSVNAYPTQEEGLAVYFLDVTEKRQEQQALYATEQNLRAIINNTSDIIWSMDRDLNIISANEAFWDYLKHMVGTTQGLTKEHFKQTIYEAWEAHLMKALEGKAFKFIWEEDRGTETYYAEVSLNPIFGKDRVSGVSCFSRDITEERKLQQRIARDERNLRALIDNSQDMIWSVDSNLCLVTANEVYKSAIFSITSHYPEEGGSILIPEYSDELTRQWKQHYETALAGTPYTHQETVGSGENARYMQTYLYPITDGEGHVVGVSCNSRDVTVLKKHIDQIEQQNEVLREIAWIQSHKIRNHVATILGLAEILETDASDQTDNQIIIEGVKSAAGSLDQIIREVNELTKKFGKG
ncbi:MAG: PAS domain S-box protein [Sphingobacteriales bacterium]|nr:MAG: PAS domain S-box protein [Sphingobacteriales bacterium]